MYRSAGFVKNILDRVGVPTRPVAVEERKGYAYLPEQCVAEDFADGETVWSAFYHAPATYRKRNRRPEYYIEKVRMQVLLYICTRRKSRFGVGGFLCCFNSMVISEN